MEQDTLEELLKKGIIKARPYCNIVYEITEKGTSLRSDIKFEMISSEYYLPHPECEKNYFLDITRIKCGSE